MKCAGVAVRPIIPASKYCSTSLNFLKIERWTSLKDYENKDVSLFLSSTSVASIFPQKTREMFWGSITSSGNVKSFSLGRITSYSCSSLLPWVSIVPAMNNCVTLVIRNNLGFPLYDVENRLHMSDVKMSPTIFFGDEGLSSISITARISPLGLTIRMSTSASLVFAETLSPMTPLLFTTF